MSPVRAIVLVMSAAAVAFLRVCGTALAGTYTWNLSSDFTSVPPGANPDHDHYGARVWSYVTQPTANTFALLPNFSSSVDGALAGWASSPSGLPPFVAIRTAGNPTTDGAQVAAGQIALQPSSSEPAIVAWTSALSASPTVPPGGTVYLEVNQIQGNLSTACDTAANGFGGSQKVTGRLSRGSAATGRPPRTIGVTAGGPRWSERWPQSLAPGLYTLRATQSDDAGHTTVAGPHTFHVVLGSSEIGAGVALGRNEVFSVPITCVSPTGTSCTGTVPVLTTRSFQPVAGRLKLRVSADLSGAGGSSSVRRQLRLH